MKPWGLAKGSPEIGRRPSAIPMRAAATVTVNLWPASSTFSITMAQA